MRRYIPLLILAVIVVAGAYAAHRAYAERADISIWLADTFDALALPYRVARISLMEADTELIVPIQGLRASAIADSWDAPRAGGRTHEGVDMFAARGTPVFAAASGFVLRVSEGDLGGTYVFTIGKGGVRYYYAHLDRVAAGIHAGSEITTDTVIGYVGNTGNAADTPPHLHFGMYQRGAQNPYDLLVTRE